jgi:hypothetical protein
MCAGDVKGYLSERGRYTGVPTPAMKCNPWLAKTCQLEVFGAEQMDPPKHHLFSHPIADWREPEHSFI